VISLGLGPFSVASNATTFQSLSGTGGIWDELNPLTLDTWGLFDKRQAAGAGALACYLHMMLNLTIRGALTPRFLMAVCQKKKEN
jgi:hypothetical protein